MIPDTSTIRTRVLARRSASIWTKLKLAVADARRFQFDTRRRKKFPIPHYTHSAARAHS